MYTNMTEREYYLGLMTFVLYCEELGERAGYRSIPYVITALQKIYELTHFTSLNDLVKDVTNMDCGYGMNKGQYYLLYRSPYNEFKRECKDESIKKEIVLGLRDFAILEEQVRDEAASIYGGDDMVSRAARIQYCDDKIKDILFCM